MSYHILHVRMHGCSLHRDRGHLLMKPPKEDRETVPERRLPLEDIRAVVIAGRGVTITCNALSGLLSHDAIILHCDESYAPIGITTPLARLIDARAFLHQALQPKTLNEKLWLMLLMGKTANQIDQLASLHLRSPHLERALQRKLIDEGNCAKHYWQLFFPAIGYPDARRDREAAEAPNQWLNYGYTVLATLCHRSLLLHGLSPLLGVGHIPRYRSHPLVYDIMEPYRLFVDQMLAEFATFADTSEDAWCRYVGGQLHARRVSHQRYTLKLVDAIDKTASTLAQCYTAKSASLLWIPRLAEASSPEAVQPEPDPF
jgi:CRISP-associated protein Cas1